MPQIPRYFLFLALGLGLWFIPSSRSASRLSLPFRMEMREFICLVMVYPEEDNFDKFEFVVEKYKRVCWRAMNEQFRCID